MDKEAEGEMSAEGEDEEATTSTEVDKGSPVVLDSDLRLWITGDTADLGEA